MPSWPSLILFQPDTDSVVHRFPEPWDETPFEAGPNRRRRLFSIATTEVEQVFVWTRRELRLFRAWYRDELNSGEAWFDMPIFTGAVYRTSTVRFSGLTKPQPAGGLWRVEAKLEVPDLGFDDPGTTEPTWPATLPSAPTPEDLQPAWHEEHLRSDWESGPVAVRRRFNTMASQQQVWDWSPAQYEVFRSWFRVGLVDGLRWFEVPFWTGDEFVTVKARFAKPPEAQLRGGVAWRVGGTLETRRLPGASWTELSLEYSVAALHHIVHTGMPAAMPAT